MALTGHGVEAPSDDALDQDLIRDIQDDHQLGVDVGLLQRVGLAAGPEGLQHSVRRGSPRLPVRFPPTLT